MNSYKNKFIKRGWVNLFVIFTIFILLFLSFPLKMQMKNLFQKNKEVKQERIVTLENNGVLVKVLPGIGGRIVSLQKGDGQNILKTKEELWNYKFTKPVEELIINNKIPFNGHIVWVGPQSEWWIHQSVNKKLKDKIAHWPPDPFLIYGGFKVVDQNKSSIELVGPKSKFTGVQLTKKITISDEGKVNFFVEAKNIRKENIAWDLWLNTRIDGFAKVYVPLSNKDNFRMQYRKDEATGKMQYEIENGYFSFKTKPPEKDKNKIDGKAFIYPSNNKIFAFTNNKMFVICFQRYDKNLVHPEQAMIEIYNSVTAEGDALMELEYHTPYQTIKPGETIYGEETWDIVKYRNGSDTNAHLKFIDAYFKINEIIQ